MMKSPTQVDIGTLSAEVVDIVSQIPPGRVMSYGQIARLAGWPHHARLVGRILRHADEAALPCHRVVAASGRLAPHFSNQADLLEAEGVVCSRRGFVDMQFYRWLPGEEVDA